jgi:hypothetical protein
MAITLGSISSVIERHEKLILALILSLVIWGAIGKVKDTIAAHDQISLQHDQIVATAQASKDATTAALAQQQAAAFQAQTAAAEKEKAALLAANTQLQTALASQQKTDSTLPPTELVQRWNTLVPEAGASVAANGVTLPEQGAASTVQQLEQVPAQQQELANVQNELKTDDGLLQSAAGLNKTLTDQVSGLQLEIKDNKVVCNQQLAVQKDDYEKKLRHRTFWAALGGMVLEILIRR